MNIFIFAHEQQKTGEDDLKWRLTELFQDVVQQDEQKFIDVTGMSNYLKPKSKESALEKEASKFNEQLDNKTDQKDNNSPDEKKKISKAKKDQRKWPKLLFKKAVKKCHPDVLKFNRQCEIDDFIDAYKEIVEAYENDNLDRLMVECFKVKTKPDNVISEQIIILQNSIDYHNNKYKNVILSQGYAWFKLSPDEREVFLINLMKQRGVRFVDKEKVREVLNKRKGKRKIGEKPVNMRKLRVKK